MAGPTEPKPAPPLKVERLAQLSVLLLMAVGCWLVLEPFLPAILFSTAIVVSTWPIHEWIVRKLRGRRVAASVVSCLLVTIVVVTPTALLMMSFRDAAIWLLGLIKEWQTGGQAQLPDWLTHIPVIGHFLQNLWEDWSSSGAQLMSSLAEPAQRIAVASGKALGNGLLQILIAAVLLFFLFRDGDTLAQRVRQAAEVLGGTYAKELLTRAEQTVTGIMLSVVGAALAQATLATIGFRIAGVPNAYLLGALTFALSIVPVGPPLIWGGAALWLFEQSQTGWAVFMVIYGLLGISSIDNVLKPFLISRSSALPFAATLVGVVGGAFAFGIAGVFLGPMLLALTIEVLRHRLEWARAGD